MLEPLWELISDILNIIYLHYDAFGWKEFHNQRHGMEKSLLRKQEVVTVNRMWNTCIRHTQIIHV